jgi:hypothetical protein
MKDKAQIAERHFDLEFGQTGGRAVRRDGPKTT